MTCCMYDTDLCPANFHRLAHLPSDFWEELFDKQDTPGLVDGRSISPIRYTADSVT